MPKINQEEYEVLKKALSDGYEWIARDSHNPLCAHRHKPVKQEHWIQQYWGNAGNGYKEIDNRLFQFIQWEDEEPYNIQELIDEYLDDEYGYFNMKLSREFEEFIKKENEETEQPKITLQDVTDKLWELPFNNRKLWLARLNDEFQEGYIVPLGLKTTDGEEQYLTYNGSYFASRRNKHLQQTFDTLEDIPEFYRGLAERVL